MSSPSLAEGWGRQKYLYIKEKEKNKTKIRHLTVLEYVLHGVQLIKPGPRPDLTPRGFNFNFPTGIPLPIIVNGNHSHPKLEPREFP